MFGFKLSLLLTYMWTYIKFPSRCNSYSNKTRQIYTALKHWQQAQLRKEIDGHNDKRWHCFSESQFPMLLWSGCLRVEWVPVQLRLSSRVSTSDDDVVPLGLAHVALSLWPLPFVISHLWHQSHGKHKDTGPQTTWHVEGRAGWLRSARIDGSDAVWAPNWRVFTASSEGWGCVPARHVRCPGFSPQPSSQRLGGRGRRIRNSG